MRNILFTAGHTLNALAAAVLCLIGIDRLTLDIAHICKRKHAGFFGNQILNIDLAADADNLGAALVRKFVADSVQLCFHDFQHTCFRAENFQIIGNLPLQFVAFFQNLFNFQACQLTETVRHNRRRLRVVKAEFLHNCGFRFGRAALTGTDGRDNFIHNIDCAGETL